MAEAPERLDAGRGERDATETAAYEATVAKLGHEIGEAMCYVFRFVAVALLTLLLAVLIALPYLVAGLSVLVWLVALWLAWDALYHLYGLGTPFPWSALPGTAVAIPIALLPLMVIRFFRDRSRSSGMPLMMTISFFATFAGAFVAAAVCGWLVVKGVEYAIDRPELQMLIQSLPAALYCAGILLATLSGRRREKIQ